MRVKQVNVDIDTKSKDDVTMHLSVAIQYRVIDADGGRKAFYGLTDIKSQMKAYVEDSVRSAIPKMDVDEVFESRDTIAKEVKDDLAAPFDEYGVEICDVLVTDMKIDMKVQVAMNDVNASDRIKQATIFKAEASKTMAVMGAEAEAESKYLSGLGLARERKAIVGGLQTSVTDFTKDVDIKSNEVLNLLMTTLYTDSLRDMGTTTENSTILVVGNQGGLQDRMRQRLAQKNKNKNTTNEMGAAAEQVGLLPVLL
jgi:regulator of protease activity HflC (stomatin/prohibitin superfamily)